MKQILREIFSDESGHLSSNRVLGAIAWFVGLVLACLGKTSEATVVMGVAGAKLGVGQIKSAVVKSSQPATPNTQTNTEPTQTKTTPTPTQKEKGDL